MSLMCCLVDLTAGQMFTFSYDFKPRQCDSEVPDLRCSVPPLCRVFTCQYVDASQPMALPGLLIRRIFVATLDAEATQPQQ
jgi:hypothetical protein